jgi:hypothetical protein
MLMLVFFSYLQEEMQGSTNDTVSEWSISRTSGLDDCSISTLFPEQSSATSEEQHLKNKVKLVRKSWRAPLSAWLKKRDDETSAKCCQVELLTTTLN